MKNGIGGLNQYGLKMLLPKIVISTLLQVQQFDNRTEGMNFQKAHKHLVNPEPQRLQEQGLLKSIKVMKG